MINCVIIEDEPQAVILLKNILSARFPEIRVLADFDKISLAAAYIRDAKPELVFLDVQLNGELGIDIANYLDKDELDFDIIFTTAYGGFAVEAFALSAIDYVLKPLRENRLVEAVNRVLKKRLVSADQLRVLQALGSQEKIERIVLSMNEKKIIVHTADIAFLKADNVYTEFYLQNNDKHVVSRPLKEYEALVGQDYFFRPHRSHIVNLSYMKAYHSSESEIEMFNGRRLSLSRERKKEFDALVASLRTSPKK